MTIVSSDIKKAAEFLNEGKLVAVPTETVYGLAANIYNKKAIEAIFELKKRPLFNPLIVHIHSMNQLQELVDELPEKAKTLAASFWPGELTLVLKKKSSVPDLITAGKNTVAIRIPKHPVMIELLKYLDFPLAAPSANPFGSISPTNAARVKAYFDGTLPMVLDGGSCASGIESTIIGFQEDEVIIYRYGAISLEAIEAKVGKVKSITKNNHSPQAPGMLHKHYAPSTPLFLVDKVAEALVNFENLKIGVLAFTRRLENSSIIHQEILSETGNLKEAALNLYEAMHRLDELKLDLIIAEKFPNDGIGKSLNDRLERASAKQ